MKSIFVAAIIAAACSGVALAGELKQDQKTAAPVIKGTVMNDAEMDKVAAGSGVGFGVNTAANHTNAVSNAETVVGNLVGLPVPFSGPGFGKCTAGRPPC